MKKKTKLFVVFFLFSIFVFSTSARAWRSFVLPRAIVGGSVGYFGISLDDFEKTYRSHWNYFYSGNLNIRVYRNNFATIQYARYENDKVKSNQQEANWQEDFLNIGVRMYSSSTGKWNFYTGFGFTFITVKEESENPVLNDNESKGNGFFLEIGTNYSIFYPIALSLEFEISSAGEGGKPGFIGHSIGGYAFLVGMDFQF